MDPKLFSSWVHSSQGSGVVETEVWTADKQPVALLAKNCFGSASNSAARDKGHKLVLSTRKMVINQQPTTKKCWLLAAAAAGCWLLSVAELIFYKKMKQQ
jgi:hypothetical protein